MGKVHPCRLGVPNAHRGDKIRNSCFTRNISEVYIWARWLRLPAGLQIPNAYCWVEFQLATSPLPSLGATCGQSGYISPIILWAN